MKKLGFSIYISNVLAIVVFEKLRGGFFELVKRTPVTRSFAA